MDDHSSVEKTTRTVAHRAKIAEVVNVINFELNGLMLHYGSPGVPQSPKSYNSVIEVQIHKISVITP